MSRSDSKSNYAGSSRSSDNISNASTAVYADKDRPQNRSMISISSLCNPSQSAYGSQAGPSTPQTERVLRYASAPDGGPPNGGLAPGVYLDKETNEQFYVGYPPLARPSDGSYQPPSTESISWPREWAPPPVGKSRYQFLWSHPDPRLQDDPHPLYHSGYDSPSSSHRDSSHSSHHTGKEDQSVAFWTSRSNSPSGSRAGSSRKSGPGSRYG